MYDDLNRCDCVKHIFRMLLNKLDEKHANMREELVDQDRNLLDKSHMDNWNLHVRLNVV